MDENRPDVQEDMPSMADLFREVGEFRQPRPGDIRWGVIAALSLEGAVVEMGAAQKGIVPSEDLKKLPPREHQALHEGQETLVYVTEVDDSETVRLSIYLARREEDWLRAEELLHRGLFWEGRVSGHNKGGLIVPFGHIRGFIPASQITGLTRRLPKEKKMARLSKMVGQRVALKVIEVDRRQRRLLFSERQGQVARRNQTHQKILAQLRKGQTCRGRVRGLTEYGAFVDLGGVVGLVHRTELAWFRVEHPCEIIAEGQEVDVYVLRVSEGQSRISLSIKRTYPDPWPKVLETYQLNQLVEGRVIRHTGAGVFVLLDDRVLGLIPQSDFQKSRLTGEEVEIGRRVLARLVRIDAARHRLGLSLRRVRNAEWADWRKRLEQKPEHESKTAAHASTES